MTETISYLPHNIETIAATIVRQANVEKTRNLDRIKKLCAVPSGNHLEPEVIRSGVSFPTITEPRDEELRAAEIATAEIYAEVLNQMGLSEHNNA